MNRFGFSLSYSQLLKYRNRLATCMIHKSSDEFVPIPSQLNKENFTISITSIPFNYEEGESEKLISTARSMVTLNPLTSKYLIDPKVPPWAGIHALLSDKQLSLKNVGFLPIIPNPVTRHDTVFTCLRNFSSICSNLDQEVLPVACDEGVYQYVVDIYLCNSDIFHDIFPMLGGFHMCKASLRCVGKNMRGSGFEDALLECGIFGVKILQQVFSGSHYVRSFAGMVIIEEAVLRLKWEAFWKTNQEHANTYSNQVSHITELRNVLSKKDSQNAKGKLNEMLAETSFATLFTEFESFIQNTCHISENCKYFENYLYLISLVKNLVRADRNCEFLLHVKNVGELLPLFIGCDGINYVRYSTFYYESLKNLSTKHPALYQQFILSDFVVKTNEGSFNAVACDMKLEQTINRSAKSTMGIIGKTKALDYVTEWQLIYHEVMDITHTFRALTDSVTDRSNEICISRHLSDRRIAFF